MSAQAPRIAALVAVAAVATVAMALAKAATVNKVREAEKEERSRSFDGEQPGAVAQQEAHVEEDEGDDGEEVDDATFGRDGRLAQQSHRSKHLESYRRSAGGNSQAFLNRILENLVGGDMEIETNFGIKRVVYCDWTASAKGLRFVEEYISQVVLPYYANTHSMENRMGLQTTCFREEAREIIQLACNANRKKDVVLFVGNGMTGAIQKMIGVLGLNGGDMSNKCVVFVGPYEHTSNLVVWRESQAKVVIIPEKIDGSGTLDMNILSKLLDEYTSFEMKIGCFSACSNVTGVIENVDAVTATLHKKGALAFWDYASAGPYCDIDMNPVSTGEDRSYLQKDAVFVSTHKFVGGVGGTGVLVAKRSLFNNRVPNCSGGGTVYFVDESGHRFLSDIVSREEGGTPNIVGAIRAGLAFKIKQTVGVENILKRDNQIVEKVYKRLGQLKDEIVLFGPSSPAPESRVPTFSFLVRKNGRFLHHNFVVALLSDLYGIQSRGGCLCAGPYVQNLLGMSKADVERLESTLIGAVHQREQYRPGVTRISIPYFFDDERVDYILDAICDIAQFGWRLLPLYQYENRAGEWGHRHLFQKFPQRIWLADFLQCDAKESISARSLTQQRADALQLLKNPPSETSRLPGSTVLEDESEDWLRWFVLPSEAAAELRGESVKQPISIIIKPENYLQCIAEQSASSMQQVPKKKVTSEQEVFVCPIRPPSSKRDAKQPKRLIAQDTCILNESQLAFRETVERHLSLTAQMSEAQLFPILPSKIMKLVVQASKEWSMINPGDRLLLGLSGGKDSLCLLHCLLQIQKRAPFRFELACCTIEPGAGDAFDPSPLIPYVRSLGVEYHFEKTDIFETARGLLGNAASYCSFCARMKRGALYGVARRHGYTALVLAQHLDDFVESFFMSAIRNGCLRTMKANYVEKKGEVRIIRPLCYVRERDIKEFSFSAKLPVINENCPACFSAPTERERVKRFLKDQESVVPKFFDCVRKAILPLMDIETYGTLKKVEDRLRDNRNENKAIEIAKESGEIERKKRNKNKNNTPNNEDIVGLGEELDG